MAIERKIYSEWAYTENEDEKAQINREIYQEIKDKAKVKFVRWGYAHAVYEIVENPENLSELELALICDTGNLCFGYRSDFGTIKIHID